MESYMFIMSIDIKCLDEFMSAPCVCSQPELRYK